MKENDTTMAASHEPVVERKVDEKTILLSRAEGESSSLGVNLLGMDREQLGAWVAQQGERPFRVKQLFAWMHQRFLDDFDQMTDISKAFRNVLSQKAHIKAPYVATEQISVDGTVKWAMSLEGGNVIESVFIPEDDRGTLCVSSQIGCIQSCAFCATGQQGFNRNLTTAEIVGQLWLANRLLPRPEGNERAVSNVVLMGMGEPLANLEAVIPAVKLMIEDCAYNLSRRRVTVSTSGVVPGIDRLKEECPVSLAVSLHAPDNGLRDQLIPINQKYPIELLMAACERYLENAPKSVITFEYVMLLNVNDSLEHAKKLVSLLSSIPCKINLISFNAYPGSSFASSDPERMRRFADYLIGKGFVTTIRKSRGDDISAACGQLAGQVVNRRKIVRLK